MAMSSAFIRVIIVSIFLFICCIQTPSAAAAGRVPKAYTNFVRTKCSFTTNPSFCTKTLSPYASAVKTNPLYLCNVALNIAIKSAKNASKSITKLISQKGITRTEAALIKECIGDIKDVIYELRDTLNAMAHLGDPDRDFEWSNAKTRASAAITDAETCKDGFAERKVNKTVKKKISSYITSVENYISNALSLINHLF